MKLNVGNNAYVLLHWEERKRGRERESQDEGSEGSRKDGFRIYHLEVSIRNPCSMKRLLDQDRMAEPKVIEKLFL